MSNTSEATEVECIECGKGFMTTDADADICTRCAGGIVSEDEASLDRMVEAASRPNLAQLFKRGQDRGWIKPTVEYGNG